MNKSVIVILGLIFGLIIFSIFHHFSGRENNSENQDNLTEQENQAENGEKTEPNNSAENEKKPSDEVCDYHRYVIQEGDIPADIFSEQAKYDANDMVALLAEAEEIYPLTKLVIGREIRFCFDDGEKATYFEYDRNTEEMIVGRREGDDFTVEQKPIEYEVEEVLAKGVIKNFLYADALEQGISEATIITLGDIFSYDVDFTTEIREGDEFALIYEKRKRFGQEATDGHIAAAKFVNEGETYWAFYFEDGENSGYYDGDGKMLQRQFLRAPLSYRYISSGYTEARFHPITKTVTAHHQIDYAAATGTPVVATAKGKVVKAGWGGGWGNIVRLEHANGYSTHYAHLSKFGKNIKVGQEVAQNQIVGYVGSTGWSTGPHLDYGMKLNGSPVNPLALKLPKGDPVSEENREKFEAMKSEYEAKF
jgi:murein DD-endopeptidase MepM/ murein hydrolase activator NlpD